MPRNTPPRFRKTLLALAAGAALAPFSAWALDLAQSPPGTVEPYVRPNVILSLDDSTSMDGGMDAANGTYLGTRLEVLKKAVKETFSDENLLPNKKIRLAWQSMNECTELDKRRAGDLLEATDATATTSTKMNLMRVYEGTHRANFMRYIDAYRTRNQTGWRCNSGTYTHSLMKAADDYMRAATHKNGPWSSNPGGSNTASTEYLGCRRNFHIVLTDGGWNSGMANTTPLNYDGTTTELPDGTPYDTSDAQTQLYRDTDKYTESGKNWSADYSLIADWAFRSWATPLRPASDLQGKVQPAKEYRVAPATETFENRVTKTKATLNRYWNPRYNPATWAHMVTFTIGFSSDALPEKKYNSAGTDKGAITAPTSLLPYGYDGNLADYANGTYRWFASKDKGHDMWHAALNGRGQFYAVEKGEDLKKAFQQIIGNINTAADPDLSASATSGSNLSRSSVGKYTAGYEPTNFWKGFVKADTVTSDGTTAPAPGWEGKSTADRLDALSGVSSRLILSWSDQWVSIESKERPKGGVPFKWATDETNLSTAQKAMLGLAPTATGVTVETNGQNRLNYIRGDRTLEGVDPTGYTSTKPYRQRKSRQGDIINSDVWYTGAPAGDSLLKGYAAFVRAHKSRPGMLYVGGNDGMLHGFAAADGQEKLAYVPRGVIPTLTYLSAPAYNDSHKYFVDGTPMTGDVDLNGGMQDPKASGYDAYTPDWRTLLVGTLGAGGKGYFVLDVTNPTATAAPGGSAAPAFTETNAASLVVLDRSRGTTEPAPNCTAMPSGTEKTACVLTVDEDKDIGHITTKPVTDDNDDMRATQITRMNDNRWAVVMGNGYNSVNQRPVLLIQYLDGDKKLLRLQPTTDAAGSGKAADNGLGAPRLVDLNGDGRVDIAYAGDNLGNLWKFDLTSATASNWAVAFDGAPLFTASGPAALNGTTRPKVQPISTPPTVRANDRMKTVGTGTNAKNVRVGGMMVAFGTGRNVGRTDPESVDVQTLYSVLDNTRYREVGTGAAKRLEVHPGGGSCPNGADCVPTPAALGAGVTTAKLAQQVVEELSSGELGGIKPANADNELKLDTWANFNGWYLDLPAVGERLLKGMKFYDSSNLMTVYSQVPAKGSDVDPNVESCESVSVDEERQYRSFINIMDGKAPSVAVVDANNDGKFNMSTGDGFLVNGKYISISRKKVEKGPHVIITTANKDENVGITAKNNKEKLAPMPEESLRPSWRQLQ